jgi:Sulfotransferase family
MVKSVHAALALEWLAERFSPRVVVVLRHPLNIVASYLEFGWLDAGLHASTLVRSRHVPPWVPAVPLGAAPVTRVAWQTALLSSVLQEALDRHGDWHAVHHEDLCRDPEGGFRRLYDQLGLTWTEAAAGFLRTSNRPGRGITTNRVTGDQPERWRHRLTYAQVEEVRKALALFPTAARFEGAAI